MNAKILTLTLCLTCILAQNIQAQTTSEPISNEEATEFWTAFITCCFNGGTIDLTPFVEDSVLNREWSPKLREIAGYFSPGDPEFDEIYFKEISENKYLKKKDFIFKDILFNSNPLCCFLGDPKLMIEGCENVNFQKNPTNTNEYFFKYKRRPGNYMKYCFRKTDGKIRLYSIYEE